MSLRTGATLVLSLLLATSLFSQSPDAQPVDAHFQPTKSSLEKYKYPEWFRDAKFGIWAHWGPQAVPRRGDWYARLMYQEGSADYKDHLARWGHPSQSGYKDIIPLWKAERWHPDSLMALYKKAGAKYFVSMGSHHDNFFLWNSKIHRWNAVNMGPHKDVVGGWQAAAKKQGLYFGVSEHLAASYTWFQASHRADSTGAYKGVPYDGNDPQYQDLYHTRADSSDRGWLTTNAAWAQEWYADIKELVDSYHPDLLYSDSRLPFGETGNRMLANFYNGNYAFHRGDMTAIYTCKEESSGYWTQDVERGVLDSISVYPWQTDTSIGDWFYSTGQSYKSSLDILRMLVDVVSKNGNLLINIVQTPEGDLEPDMLKTLQEIGDWMAVNGEGIYGTRPWKIYGEKDPVTAKLKAGNFNEGQMRYSSKDIRFTTKGHFLYAYSLDASKEDIVIASLGKNSKVNKQKIRSVSFLGSKEKVSFQQTDDALIIQTAKGLGSSKLIGIKLEME